MAAKDDLGRRGEDLAAQYLVDGGYSVIDRNWRCARGEIDVVAHDGNDTVFVEVKTRSSTAFGHPFEAITARKLARLRRLAIAWCEAHPRDGGVNRDEATNPDGPHKSVSRPGGIRIDAISVIATEHSAPVIEHLRRLY